MYLDGSNYYLIERMIKVNTTQHSDDNSVIDTDGRALALLRMPWCYTLLKGISTDDIFFLIIGPGEVH